jgi:death on curing protein
MTAAVQFLDLDDVFELAKKLLGDPPPVRDVGLLGSAVARPQTTVFGEDAYPDLWMKAAALLQSIVNNHALVDGNKRLGWLSTAVFLDINGVNIAAARNDDVYDFVIAIASEHRDLHWIATGLRRLADSVEVDGSSA